MRCTRCSRSKDENSVTKLGSGVRCRAPTLVHTCPGAIQRHRVRTIAGRTTGRATLGRNAREDVTAAGTQSRYPRLSDRPFLVFPCFRTEHVVGYNAVSQSVRVGRKEE